MYDVLIIGAGQAGLAVGAALKQTGRSFVILTADEVGTQWRRCYDSLQLFTPRQYSSLPGSAMQGDPQGYAGKEEFADYLCDYARHFNLPIVQDTVTRLSKVGEECIVETLHDMYRAHSVVIATGYRIPWMPSGVSGMHSSAYRRPEQIPSGSVLVVGGGNSGAQIAVELSRTHEVTIALTHRLQTISPTYFGRSFTWWQQLLGIDRIPSDSPLGTLFARTKDYVVGRELPQAIARGLIKTRPAVVRTEGNTAWFSDGRNEVFDTIIWATGYRADYSFIDIPNALTHRRGISKVQGLYFVGLRNQITPLSGNIWGTHVNTPYLLKRMCA